MFTLLLCAVCGGLWGSALVAFAMRWKDDPWRVVNLSQIDVSLLLIGRETEEQRYAELTGCDDVLLRESARRISLLQQAITVRKRG